MYIYIYTYISFNAIILHNTSLRGAGFPQISSQRGSIFLFGCAAERIPQLGSASSTRACTTAFFCWNGGFAEQGSRVIRYPLTLDVLRHLLKNRPYAQSPY